MSTIQIQLPESVLEQARKLAAQDEIPLDYFVALAITERVSSQRGVAYIKDRARLASREKFLAALAKSPDVAPDPGDELP